LGALARKPDSNKVEHGESDLSSFIAMLDKKKEMQSSESQKSPRNVEQQRNIHYDATKRSSLNTISSPLEIQPQFTRHSSLLSRQMPSKQQLQAEVEHLRSMANSAR
jgi:hypothetical protein